MANSAQNFLHTMFLNFNSVHLKSGTMIEGLDKQSLGRDLLVISKRTWPKEDKTFLALTDNLSMTICPIATNSCARFYLSLTSGGMSMDIKGIRYII